MADGVWATEPKRLCTGVYVARSVISDGCSGVPVRVVNTNDAPIALNAGLMVSNLQPVTVCEPGVETKTDAQVDPKLVVIVDEMMGRVDKSIPDDICQKLCFMLLKYSDEFYKDENDIGLTHLDKHEILTGSHQPIREPLRLRPPAHEEVIRKHVKELLAQGVIEPSRSPWASNLVLAKKADGTLRGCCEMRKLNAISTFDAFPMKMVGECLQSMAKARYFSSSTSRPRTTRSRSRQKTHRKLLLERETDFGNIDGWRWG